MVNESGFLEQSSVVRSPLHLLLVEDVVEDAELIILALEEAGMAFTYDRAETSEECQRLLSSHVYDAILSDYGLPGWNAYRVLEFLQDSSLHIPFVLVTGSLGEEAAVECIRAGMTDYVLKDRLFRLSPVLERALKEFEVHRQKQVAIAQLEQQAQRETIINRIVQAMRGTLVLSEVLQSTVDQLHEALGISRCWVAQPTEQKEIQIKHLSQASLNREQMLDTSCPFLAAFHLQLVDGQRIVMHNIETLSRNILGDESLSNQALQRHADHYQVKALVLAPLIYQTSYLGVLGIHQCHQSRHWTNNELEIIRAIADHCAIAMHQVELYQQAQRELTERKRVEAQLRYDAFHDTLTGLANRALLMDRLEQALRLVHSRHKRQTTYHYNFAVLFLDLDHFKVVNDSLGHFVGDILLQNVAQRLSHSLRTGDSIARLGGDEFVFLIEDIDSIQEALDVARRVHHLLEEPFKLEDQEIFIGASIGVAISSTYYQKPSQILRDADTAMYSAKEQGRSCHVVFDRSMHTQAMRRLNLENDLRRAIENQEFRVYYQPIFNLETQEIYSFEALVRWQHPSEGLVMPGEFIPVAEETGLVTDIDLWVCQKACEQLRRWQEYFPHLSQLKVNINFSGRHFIHGHFPEQIQQVLDRVSIQSQALKIEITESTLIKNAHLSQDILGQLRLSGFDVCIDDFGTGYSSLSYLHRFPINTLKVDRSFVSNLGEGEDNQEIIRAIVNLGLNLNLSVVAEGIETEEQYLRLKTIGCHYGQGYWFSKALSEKDATQLLIEKCEYPR